MLIQENVALAPLTTMQVGGAARYFAEAGSAGEVREAVEYANSRKLALLVLGGGSNVIVSDQGWPGLVLKVAIAGINHRHGHGTAYFDVGAGEDWDGFVAMAEAQLLWRRVPERYSRKRGRDTGTERGRLRAGSGGDDRFAGGARCRDRGRARVRG